MGPRQQVAFDKLKLAFKSRHFLVPIKAGCTYDLYTDASGIACGAVLLQEGEPVEFYSRRLTPVEQRDTVHTDEKLSPWSHQ